MFHVKRLSIKPFMFLVSRLGSAEKCNPVFNKNGWYCMPQIGLCWFELNGKAFLSNKDDFKYHLNLLNASEYDPRILAALEALPNKLKTDKQRKLAYFLREFKQRKLFTRTLR